MWVIWVAAGAAGLKFGFDFGLSISGVWMGLAMAVTTALFGTMMADGLMHWLVRLRGGGREES
jgi:hypothetical protein